jgi:RHS repeat-associated protein
MTTAQTIHDRANLRRAAAGGWSSGAAVRARHALAMFSFIAAGAAHAQVPSNPFDYARASSFSYFGASDGAKNGLLKSETVEPGNPQLCVTTTYDYDAYGNKYIATTANCAAATSSAMFVQRTSSSTFSALPAQNLSVAGTLYTGVTAAAGIFATTAKNALDQSETRQYDPRFGVVTQLTGPNGLATSWELDDFGRKVKELRADGTSTVSLYCYTTFSGIDLSSNSPGCPTPTPSNESPAVAVMFVHTETRAANGAKMGPYVRVYSDKLGRQVRTITESFDGGSQPGGYGATQIFQDAIYNAGGAKIAQTQPYFKSSRSSTTTGANDLGMSSTVYDVLGRPTTVYVADPNGSQPSGTFPPAAYGYPAQPASIQTVAYNGLTTTTVNDKSQQRTEEKNPNGQTVRVTDHTGAQIAYQHDAFGNLLTTKDALQNQITVAYDIRGRKTQMNDPDNGVWGYCYDALGQLVSQQNSKMRGNGTPGACPAAPSTGTTATPVAGWTTLAYDKLGRMTSRAEPEYVSSWYYDKYADASACNKGIGKLCESNTSNGVNKKTYYDGFGRPISTRTSTTSGITAGPSFASAVTYDGNTGRVDSQTYPTGLKVGYTYTTGAANGYLDKLTLLTPATVNPLPATPGGTRAASQSLPTGTMLWQAKVVNAWGNAEQQTYGNGVATQAVLEAATGRTKSLQAGAGNTVLNQTFSWDSLNNLTGRIDSNGDGNTGAVNETFSYLDGLNRLTQYTVSAPGIPGLSRTVSLQYNALGMLLSKSDVGDYTYAAQGPAAVRPHALQSVIGAVNTSYSFDANGNVTGSSGNTKYSALTYTSFNLPDSQGGVAGSSNGGTRYTWAYDESHARIREVRTITSGTYAGTRTTWNLHPDNQGGLGFESEVNLPTSPNGSNVSGTSNRHYLSAGGQVIGVMVTTGALPTLATGQTTPPVIASIVVVKLEYWHKDHLGSLITTTDHLGSVTQRYAYDPFGKRRYTNGSYDAFGNVVIDWSAGVNYGTERGFTGHQQLDEVGLVHMNGRIFDPTLGRFLQGDPLIQDAGNLQNYDRFGYCYGNPMSCSDPSGFDFWSSLVRSSPVLSSLKRLDNFIAKSIYQSIRNMPGQRSIDNFMLSNEWAYSIGMAAASYYGGPIGAAFVSGYTTYVQTDGDIGASRKSAGVSFATALAFSAVGTYVPSTGYANAGFWNAVAHAAVGCASAEASGGSCRAGALSGGISAGFSNAFGSVGGGDAGNIAAQMVVGGTASVLGGGKFSNGAITAAMGYIFNYLGHVHSSMSADSMRGAGGGPLDSLVFGEVVAAVDLGTQGPEYSEIHSMCAGNWSSAACDLKTADFKDKMWERKDVTGLAGLMHQMQDSFAPMHSGGQKYEGFPWYRPDQWFPHMLSDTAPINVLRTQIVNRGTQLIIEYNNQCAGCIIRPGR